MKISKTYRNKYSGYRPKRTALAVNPKLRLWRLRVLRSGLLICGLVILVRLFQIQILDQAKYARRAKDQYVALRVIKGSRGIIYDRNMMELALNRPCYDIGIDRALVKNIKKTSKMLAKVLRKNQRSLYREISGKRGFVLVARGVEPDRALAVKSMSLPGVKIEEVSERIFPFKNKAAAVLGFLSVDGNGISGLEFEYNNYLTCRDGAVEFVRDARGNIIKPADYTRKVQSGKHIVLTIDNVIQTIAEEELRQAVKQYNAKGGSIIITNPQTGEILAMAALPGYDANNAYSYPAEVHRIRPITDLYEPGSTFKIVTMAALLEGTDKKLSDLIFCENGAYKVYGEVIHDPKKHAWLTVEDAFVKSSNIGVSKLAMAIKKDALYMTARNFGFGNTTGIGLPGEVPGILKNPRHWSRFSIAAISFGHEVAVTPLQMAMAFGAIANGGELLKPMILREVLSSDHRSLEKFSRRAIRRVIDRKTARTMTGILEKVVAKGTGQAAKIGKLRIAGKTGTAQKPLSDRRGYSKSSYIASFAGFYPADSPKFLIHVSIDEPRPQYYGGKVAAPTFRRILERMLWFQDWPEPIEVTSESPAPEVSKPKLILADMKLDDLREAFIGKRKETALRILGDWGITPILAKEGSVVRNVEVKTLPGKAGQAVLLLTLADYPADSTEVTVPDLRHLSMRQAVSELSTRRLKIRIFGHGKVVRQKPAAGARLTIGATCVIEGDRKSLISLVHNRNGYRPRRNSFN